MHLDPELIDELTLLRRFGMGGPVAMDVHDNPDPPVQPAGPAAGTDLVRISQPLPAVARSSVPPRA